MEFFPNFILFGNLRDFSHRSIVLLLMFPNIFDNSLNLIIFIFFALRILWLRKLLLEVFLWLRSHLTQRPGKGTRAFPGLKA